MDESNIINKPFKFKNSRSQTSKNMYAYKIAEKLKLETSASTNELEY